MFLSKIIYNSDVNIVKIQYIAIIGSILLFLFILNLILKKKIREEYSLLWLFLCIVFIVFSFWRRGLDYISNFIGVAYPPAALFLILLMAIFIILIQFSIIISKHTESNKNLAQEHGILKMELDFLRKKLLNKKDNKNPDENTICS